MAERQMSERQSAPFYMVWVNGERFPQFKHSTYCQAIAEAKRLADLAKREAFVLSPVISFKPMENYVTTEYETDTVAFKKKQERLKTKKQNNEQNDSNKSKGYTGMEKVFRPTNSQH